MGFLAWTVLALIAGTIARALHEQQHDLAGVPRALA